MSQELIPFNRPCLTGNEWAYVKAAMESNHLSGDGHFGRLCQNWLQKKLNAKASFLTPSCTHALEMAALLLNIQPGDEVIMPSYTFVSTANAFALRGATLVFVDIRPDTLNINETAIEIAITDKTKAIVVVHYAGVSCEMDHIMKLAEAYDLYVVEDAAQALMSDYHQRPLGSIGHLSAFSFHETKNITSGGEGGALIVNASEFKERAEIIREKGTNRSRFFRGIVDKYSWVDIGSSYLPSELQAAYLWGQLGQSQNITQARMIAWERYLQALEPLVNNNILELPCIPKHAQHNGHIFYIKTKQIKQRQALLHHLKQANIMAVFHYVPLHSSPAGKQLGRMQHDEYTTIESERLIRLPLFYGITKQQQKRVVDCIYSFYDKNNIKYSKF